MCDEPPLREAKRRRNSVRISGRRESPHASTRKAITLARMQRAGALRSGDTLSFRYRDCVYYARISAEQSSIWWAATGAHYASPTSWALDCMDAYWSAHPAQQRVRTNPSGYERVRCVRSNCSLQTLRNRLLAAASDSADSGATDDTTDDSTVDMTFDTVAAASREAPPPPPPRSGLEACLRRAGIFTGV